MIYVGVIVVWLVLQAYLGVKMYKKAVMDIFTQDIENIEGDPLILFLGFFAMYKRSIVEMFVKGRLISFLIFWPLFMPIFFIFGLFVICDKYQENLMKNLKEEALKKKEESLKESALKNIHIEEDDE